ncbi:MAG: exported protein of unknown function [Candidatus Saccharibacteria bacterium]|nr:exported protein of unknown function [Candidatus Saccharibacteria bacterium]
MYRGNSSRVVPILLVLIVIAIAVAALVSAGRAIFGGDQTGKTQVDIGRDALLNTTLDHSVRMTVRGSIVADENFRSYQVVVNPTNRSLTTYSGYLDQPLGAKQYGNNAKAYEEFVYALDKANMMKGDAFSGDKDDTRGLCATGEVFEFEVLNGGNVVKRLWTTTCKGSAGSLKASTTQLETLFHNQIPDSRTILRTIDL